MQFRKKPVLIEAVQFIRPTSWTDAPEWLIEATQKNPVDLGAIHVDGDVARITTLEGVMTASKGDWIIRGVKGELYPCKPDIFAATYKTADQRPERGAAFPGYTALAPYQQRVVDEMVELDDKRAKLLAFFDTTIFAGLDKAEQSRLRQQMHAMTCYSSILDERIAAFAPS